MDRSIDDPPRNDDEGIKQIPAFETFFQNEAPVLFRRLCVITGNSAEAEEIMQDAFLALWERWDRVSGLDDPVGYLYRTAMNVFRSRLRRARLALRQTVRRAPETDPFSEIEDREDLGRVLGNLTPRQRAALVLLDGLDLTSDEAGRALGVSSGTVRGLASRARATIRATTEARS